MPIFQPKAISDPSNLSHGRHPGYLLAVLVEEIPDAFIEMKKKDTHMFRWHLAIWEHIDHVQQYVPEEQSAISSRAFSQKGKFQASKAYTWTCALIGREIPRGQSFDIDPLLPLACFVDVERVPGNDYAKIAALWGRPEGQAVIPPVVYQLQAQYATGSPALQANGQQQPSQPPPPVAQAQAPPTHAAWPALHQGQAQTPHPDTLCQLAHLSGCLTQPSGLCGEPAKTLLEGHRVCAFHEADINKARGVPQPQAQPKLPGTASRGAGAGITF